MGWRDRLRPASFRGASFHVEAGGPSGGRRVAGHEFPKRDTPYAEDMGRRGRRITIAAYVIGSDYASERDALIAAMEQEGPGLLVHPTLGERLYQPDTYSCNKSRERGEFAEFELTFVEAGSRAGATSAATASVVQSRADASGNAASSAVDKTLASGGTVSV